MILTGDDILEQADELTETYVEVFGAPPWNRAPGPTRTAFRERLGADALRPGFRAVVATSEHGIDGFATGWTTGAPFRIDRAYGKVAEQLGPDRLATLIVGGFEVDELAVRVRARGTGLGRRLLTELVDDVPDGRAWLLTARKAVDTVAFYRRTGWRAVEPMAGADNGIVVFLAPAHPGDLVSG